MACHEVNNPERWCAKCYCTICVEMLHAKEIRYEDKKPYLSVPLCTPCALQLRLHDDFE